jgi:DNA-binding CsgD family transcriptional regulator
MTREQMIEEAKRLRGEGRTYREIGVKLSISEGKAWNLANVERS